MAGRDPIDDLVDRVVARVQQRMQVEAVPPAAVLHGTWQDQSFARLVQAGADRVGTSGAVPADAGRIAGAIDHTLLSPTATRADILKVCEEARRHRFASVCVNSTWIGLVAQLLAGSTVMPICVVGFPLGPWPRPRKPPRPGRRSRTAPRRSTWSSTSGG